MPPGRYSWSNPATPVLTCPALGSRQIRSIITDARIARVLALLHLRPREETRLLDCFQKGFVFVAGSKDRSLRCLECWKRRIKYASRRVFQDSKRWLGGIVET